MSAFLEPSWKKVLENELKEPYVKELSRFVTEERKNHTVYPSSEDVFTAFWQTPYDKVKVVIVGQDPYHGPHQAHGLSFSVLPGIKQPPSLKNIFKELQDDVSVKPPNHGYLLDWAKQGVFMLNAILTVRAGEPLSHAEKGWERFTDAVIKALVARPEPLVFVLWGKSARDKVERVLKGDHHHLVLFSPHPSPFSAHGGFFGSRPFSKINEFLLQNKQEPVNWTIA